MENNNIDDDFVLGNNDYNNSVSVSPVRLAPTDFTGLVNLKKTNNNINELENAPDTLDLSDTNDEESDDEDIELGDMNNNMSGMKNNHMNSGEMENNHMGSSGMGNELNMDESESSEMTGKEVSSDDDGEEDDDGEVDYEEEKVEEKKNNNEYPEIPPENYRERNNYKQDMLIKLLRLEKAGYVASKKFTMASSYEDLLFEYNRLNRQRDIEKSIKFSRKIMMALISGIEFLNNKFDPLSIKLNGWSENIMENINDYDEVFEELHDKYSSSVRMPPEIKLLAMVAGSGFMFHLTNSLFKSASPDLQDILRQNPDIMQNISQAAMKNMQSSAGFDTSDPINKMMMQGVKMKEDKNKNLNTLLHKLQEGGNNNPVQKNNMNVFDKKDTNGISLNI